MKQFLALLVVASAVGSASEARAQWGWMGYPQWYGRNVYTVYDQDRLPYFALHPPVYYSQPVPRTYGYSPFAYPSWVMTPDAPVAEPEIIVNPYINSAPDESVPPTANPPSQSSPTPAPPKLPTLGKPNPAGRQKPTADRSAKVEPLRIINPHVGPIRTVSR